MTPPLFCLPFPIHPQASTFSVKNTFCPQPGNRNLKELSQGGRGESQNRHQGLVGHSHNQAAFLCPGAVCGQRSKDKLGLPLCSLMPPIFGPLLPHPRSVQSHTDGQAIGSSVGSTSPGGPRLSPCMFLLRLPDAPSSRPTAVLDSPLDNPGHAQLGGLLGSWAPGSDCAGGAQARSTHTHLTGAVLAQPRSTPAMPSGGAGRSSPKVRVGTT